MTAQYKDKKISKTAPVAAGALFTVLFFCAACVSTLDSASEEATGMTRDGAMSHFNYEMAEKFWKQGKDDLAVKYLRKALAADPLNMDARLGLIDIHLAEERLGDAHLLISLAPEEQRYEPELLDRQVFILEMQDDAERLALVIGEAVSKGVPHERFLTVRAEARVLLKDYTGACDLYEEARAADPEDPAVLEALARIYRLIGSAPEEGEALLKLAAVCPDDPDYPHQAAATYEAAGLRDDGIKGLEPLYAADDGRIRGDVCLALAYLYFNAARYCEAAGMYTLAQDKGDCFLQTDDRKRLAESYLRCGDYRGAAVELQALLAEDPDDAVVRAALALAFWRDGQDIRAGETVAGTPPDASNDVLNALEKRFKPRGGMEVD